jgi:CBS domain-containing protein
MVNPANAIELQRRLSSGYVDTLLAGSAAMLRATRRGAEDALRPLEERVEQRREARKGDHHPPQHRHGRVSDVMSTGVCLTSPEDTVQQAAQAMRDEDTGVLPVGEGDHLVGMVSDRDVALRLVAEGRDPRQTRVREVMSSDVRYVFDDEDLVHVAENMAEHQLRRLPVMNRDKRLVGVISLADLDRNDGGGSAVEAPAGMAGGHVQAAAE